MAFDFTDFAVKVTKALDHLTQEVNAIRTGRASIQLLDQVTVEAYGTKMKLSEVANVAVVDAQLLTVSPWDKSLLSAIEKGINSAALNLNPVIAGDVIRIVVPALTKERRQEMVKLLHQKLESGRVMVRSVRTDTKKDIEKQKGQPGVSEDDIQADIDQLELKAKHYLAEIDKAGAAKEKDLLTV